MKITFLALLLLISGTQAISTSDFNINFTSEGKSLIQSNGQAHRLLGRSYGNRSIEEDSIRLNLESENEDKHELFNAARKAQGGMAGAGNRGKTGVTGGESFNRRPRRSQSSAPSLLSRSHFWVSTFLLYVSLASIILFLFH